MQDDGRDGPGTSESLERDPRIAAFSARLELQKKDAAWRLTIALAAAAALLGAGIIASRSVDLGLGKELGVALIVGGVTYYAQEYMNARNRRSEDYADLLTLSSVLYQSADTIKHFFKPNQIHASIQTLLQARLGRKIGAAYWQQAVEPYIQEGGRGFKEEWRYDIDIRDLEQPVVVGEGDTLVKLDPDQYWELHTRLSYTQTAFANRPVLHIGCAFESLVLPRWFEEPDVFQREIVYIEPENRLRLATLLPATESTPTDGKQGRVAVARRIFDPTLTINGVRLEAANVCAEERGLRWSYETRKSDRRKSSTVGTKIEIELTTLQSKHQHYFPVYLSSPTRYPTIHFDYGNASDIEGVDVETFFSAQRPFAKRMWRHSRYGRMEVRTDPEDWVFVGSGCIFVWR